jgi:hypothetical protein
MFQKLKSSKLLSKLNTLGSYLWFVSVVIFISIILTSTKWFTHDPCYGSGCLEHPYLLPMLISLFLGCLFFGITILSGILRILFRGEKWKPFLNINSWKVGTLTVFLLILVGVYLFASTRSSVLWGGTYTGQDLFSAVNTHRQSKGLGTLKTGEGLCDNLVSRWKSVKEGKQHEGFEDWVKQEGIQINYGYKQVVELYIQANTPAEAISFWESSPGHEIELDNSRWTDGCAYANEGTGVLIMSYK